MDVTTGRVIAAAAGLTLLAGVTGGVVGVLAAGSDEPGGPVAAAAGGGPSCDVPAVAALVFPSLVTLHVPRGDAGGLGSGSVLDADGNILTNDHVAAPAAGGAITVDFARGPSGVPATVIGRDPATDLAVIRVDPGAARLSPITLGDSSALVVGQPVVAAGSPLGLYSTITAGAQTPDGDGGSIGLNFAIPIDFAISVAGQLVRTGTARQAGVPVTTP